MQVEAEVEDRRRVGEGADGEEVDAGLGDRPGPVEGQPAGGLGADAGRAAEGDRGAQVVQRHVVEQHQVGTGGDHLADLLDGVALDLDLEVGPLRADGLEGRHDAAGGDDVVVLDEGGVRQRHPVVAAATGDDRRLLQSTQPGGGLAGVADLRTGAGDGGDPGRGQRRDPGQVAEQVEGGPLGGQQGAHRAGDLEHRRPLGGRAVRRRRDPTSPDR